MCLAKIKNLLKCKKGATGIEYGLIAAGIALVIIPAVQLVGTNTSSTFTSVATALAAADAGEPADIIVCNPWDPCGAPPMDGGGGLGVPILEE